MVHRDERAAFVEHIGKGVLMYCVCPSFEEVSGLLHANYSQLYMCGEGWVIATTFGEQMSLREDSRDSGKITSSVLLYLPIINVFPL